ncbi:hypothetical protein [Nitrosomonas sp. Is79A3]|uniref:hypothetical protein n=1 Tax=Nitrosomonas sp. (strain Is79A3) TaxID=261292 RepID=UPI0002DDB982
MTNAGYSESTSPGKAVGDLTGSDNNNEKNIPINLRPINWAQSYREVRTLAGLLQRFNQEENFGGHRVIQIWRIGKRAVAVASQRSDGRSFARLRLAQQP